jgi:hypothetical protein
MHQGSRGNHFGVKAHARGNQAQKITAMAVGPVHHGRNAYWVRFHIQLFTYNAFIFPYIFTLTDILGLTSNIRKYTGHCTITAPHKWHTSKNVATNGGQWSGKRATAP